MGQASATTLKLMVAVLFVSLWGCGGDQLEVRSTWRTDEIRVDGNPGEWDGKLVFTSDGKVGYGLANDSSFLYLCLKTDQATFRRVMAAGLTVWIDSTGQEQKLLGIHYPMGFSAARQERPEDQEPTEAPPEESPGDQGELRRQSVRPPDEAEIIVDGQHIKVEPGALSSYGIEVALGRSEGTYELRLPLRPDVEGHFAVGTDPGKTCAVGLETGSFSAPARSPRMSAREGMGGDGGSGMGMPRGRGFGRRGSRGGGQSGSPDSGESINVWIKSHLALSNASGMAGQVPSTPSGNVP